MTATSEDGFKTMLDEVLQERANPAEPAGLAERVMARVSAEAAMGPVTVQGGMFETTQRVAAGRSARSTGFAVLAHVAALLAIAAAVRSGVRLAAPVKLATVRPTAPRIAERVFCQALPAPTLNSTIRVTRKARPITVATS